MKKLGAKQYDLMREAIRRDEIADSHERSKPLHLRWLGLGTAAAYRPVTEAGLMRWVNGPPSPRCMGWLHLTDEGVKVFKELKKFVKLGNHETEFPLNYMLFGGLVSR